MALKCLIVLGYTPQRLSVYIVTLAAAYFLLLPDKLIQNSCNYTFVLMYSSNFGTYVLISASSNRWFAIEMSFLIACMSSSMEWVLTLIIVSLHKKYQYRT